MTIGGILGAIIIGLVIGVLGRLFAPGKQDIPIVSGMRSRRRHRLFT